MRKRVLCLIGCIIGALLIAIPYAFAFVASALAANAPSVSIIGGADGPTAVMIMQEVSRDYFWVIILGVAAIIVSTIALLWKRK